MKRSEIEYKYSPKVFDGEMTKEMFNWLLSQGIQDKISPAEAFTTHLDQYLGGTQKQRLLALLRDRQPHDTPEIQRVVYGGDHLGVARISARILDLKADGYEIECRKKNGTIWEYRLVK